MSWILGISGVLCFIYFAAILIFSGPGTSFAFIWLAMALVLGTAASGRLVERLSGAGLPLSVRVSAATLFVTGIVVFLIVEALVFTGVAREDPRGLDYVIVLGAKVQTEGVSKSLKMRLDKAIQYSEENPDTIFVLSGGQGKDEPTPQAQVMYNYMLYNGVPADHLLMELQSTSTVENIAYSRLVIEDDLARREEEKLRRQRQEHMERMIPVSPDGEISLFGGLGPGDLAIEAPEKPVQIGVLTSNFHLFRAMEIGKKWGIPNIQGIAAPSERWMLPHFCVRECAAILKDKLMGNM